MVRYKILVVFLVTCLSFSNTQTATDCQVATYCRRVPRGTSNEVWTDLEGNVILPSVSVPMPPPPVPRPISFGLGELIDPFQGMALSDGEKLERLRTRIQLLGQPGWILANNGYQYMVSKRGVAVDYGTAQIICEAQGARIVTAGMREDESRRYIVDNILRRCGDIHAFWIGYRDVEEEGNFVWDDGVSGEGFTTNWEHPQPDNTNNADCAVTARKRDYEWDDVECEGSNNGILCERFVGYCFSNGYKVSIDKGIILKWGAESGS